MNVCVSMSDNAQFDAIVAVRNLIKSVENSMKDATKKNLEKEKKAAQVLLEKLKGRKVDKKEVEMVVNNDL